MVPLRARAASTDHAYGLVEEQRIEEAAQGDRSAGRARGRTIRKSRSSTATCASCTGEYARAAERFGEAMKLRGRVGDEAASCAIWPRHRRDDQGLSWRLRGKHFVVWHTPGKDELLAPYALDALEKALAALGDDFGWRPTEPVRVEIYPEVADLARVSTLTLKEIETSGTIALCKYNRLMIVSPRALVAGYPWLDTLNHEYTHFVVSRVSHNTVPIWLHEGLAKFEERRWRGAVGRRADADDGAPAGDGPRAQAPHHLRARCIRRWPSCRRRRTPRWRSPRSTPSSSICTSRTAGPGCARCVDGKRFARRWPRWASRSTTSSATWRTWLHGKKLQAAPGPVAAETELRFKKGARQADRGERGRLGAHHRGAGAQAGAPRRHAARAPSARGGGHRVREGAGASSAPATRRWRTSWRAPISSSAIPARAIAAAEPALELYPDQAAPNATLGEAWLRRGDNKKAAQYLEAALAINPFDPAVHCGLAQAWRRAQRPARRR